MFDMGILGDGERKSTEPIAARACPDPKQVNNVPSKLLYFLAHSKWDDRAVRLNAAKYELEAMRHDRVVTPWIIDDTGFLKQGIHSVGVQRQYAGSAGKIATCQIGVSLCAATEHDHVPLDFDLYLPQPWIDDVEQRREAPISDDAIFQTKLELALGMIERAVQSGVPGGIVLADSAYGDNTIFRNAMRYQWNLDFAVGVDPNLKVVRLDCHNYPTGRAVAIGELSNRLTRKDFRKFTWCDGTKSPMSSNFYFQRVKTTHDDGIALQDCDALQLLVEWPDGEPSAYEVSLDHAARHNEQKGDRPHSQRALAHRTVVSRSQG
jgi:SRSO17 transposase